MFEHSQKVFIKAIDTDTVEKDDSFPVAQAIYVELTETPDDIWNHYFEESWHNRIYSMKRNASIERDRVRLVVAPGEEEEAISFLKQVIESINSLIDEHNKQADIDQKRLDEAEKKNKDDQDKIQGNLKNIKL